jgi:hypothetical protein
MEKPMLELAVYEDLDWLGGEYELKIMMGGQIFPTL